jgi:hypothetical protein
MAATAALPHGPSREAPATWRPVDVPDDATRKPISRDEAGAAIGDAGRHPGTDPSGFVRSSEPISASLPPARWLGACWWEGDISRNRVTPFLGRHASAAIDSSTILRVARDTAGAAQRRAGTGIPWSFAGAKGISQHALRCRQAVERNPLCQPCPGKQSERRYWQFQGTPLRQPQLAE